MLAAIALALTISALILAAVAIFGPKPQPATYLPNQATKADITATKDHFGIDYLKPTLPGGTFWSSNWSAKRTFTRSDPSDSWFDTAHGEAIYKVNHGELFISGHVPRIYIHDPNLQRQWKNVETTVYFKRVADDNVKYAGMVAVARANHLSDTARCDTRGYGARVRYDGNTDFEKETAHPLNDAVHTQTLWRSGMPHNKWIGFKFIVFDGPTGVHLQSWLDLTDGKNGGDWIPIDKMVDKGNDFGKDPCKNGIDPRMPLTAAPRRAGSESGRPNLSVYFRSDGVKKNGLIYKWASVREITP